METPVPVNAAGDVPERYGETESGAPLLEARGLSISFFQYDRGLRRRRITPIIGLDLTLERGEVLAVIGSSGSGKSLLAHAVLGILPSNAEVGGELLFEGSPLGPEEQAKLRGRRISLVPQSVNFLDPLMRVGSQVLPTHRRDEEARDRVKSIFKRYHLEAEDTLLYPFQLSGGMARRVLVATAVISGADLIIADEPTPGLHPVVVRETLSHLRELADEGKGVLLITHDLEEGLSIADRVGVFYAGTTVEIAPVAAFAGKGERLRHPYTRALWQALPRNGFRPLAGSQPPLDSLPPGCLFQPRCPISTTECLEEKPALRKLGDGWVRCIHAA